MAIRAPVFPPYFVFSSLADAAKVSPVLDAKSDAKEGEYEYTARLREDWCMGIVPHGGYLSTVLLNTSSYAFAHQAPYNALNQPHPIYSTFTFINRCSTAPCTLTLTPLKLGRQYTFVTVILSQGSKRCLQATIIHSNLHLESGWSVATNPPPPPITPLSACTVPERDPSAAFRIAESNLEFAYPRDSIYGSYPDTKSVREQWVRLSNGSKLTVAGLGFVGDMFIPILENWINKPQKFWYPTLGISMEVKKAPAEREEGWEWVGMRISTSIVKGGRMDLDVVMYDENREVIAMGRHCAIFVGFERNMKQDGVEKGPEKGKL